MRHPLRHPDFDSTRSSGTHAACEAMSVLALDEASLEARKEAVSVLLVHLCGMSVAQYHEEGIQRLSRLWLERPPRVRWQQEAITIERVEAWLRTSVRRSEQATRRTQARGQRALSAHEQDERAHAMRTATGTIMTSARLDDMLAPLIEEVRQIADDLITLHASRKDQRANLTASFERLCHIHIVEGFDAWLMREHPHVKEPAQQRVLRDRYHQQHSRARKFLHMALLAEPELEVSAQALQFFALL